MMRLRLKLRLFLLGLAVFCVLISSGWTAWGQPLNVRELEKPERVARELFDLMNQARLERGLKALEPDVLLEKVAHGHSLKMRDEKKLSHRFSGYETLPVRMREAGIYFISYGENVAYSDTYVAKIIHDELMNSPQHRDNILDTGFTHCGIDVVKIGEEYYVTQDFARLFTPRADAEAEEHLVSRMQDWFFKEHKYPLISLAEMQAMTHEVCLGKLAGEDLNKYVANAPEEWGKFRLLSILSPDLDETLEEIKKEVGKIRVNGVSLGVRLGRNSEYPGGAYAVSILFFGDKYFELSGSELAGIVMGEINSARNTLELKTMPLDGQLSDLAMEIARRRYFTSDDNLEEFEEYKLRGVMIYKTDNLAFLPRSIDDFVLLQEFNRIGAGVFYPLKYRMTGNYFIVALVYN
jgi:hypothetical protein